MGKIEDIMIDLTTGKIEYIVIEFGGVVKEFLMLILKRNAAM